MTQNVVTIHGLAAGGIGPLVRRNHGHVPVKKVG